MEESKPAAEVEVKPEVKPEAKPTEVVKTETIGDVLDTKEKKPETKMVPEAALLEFKKDNKQLKKDLADLQRKIEGGASKEEVSADIESIGEEFGVDKKFLNKLATVIRKEADKDAEGRLADRLKPLEEKERAGKIDKVFNEHFKKAMDDLPEFADIVNREVIKSLSLDPSNQNKTFTQLIEDTYGKALPAGKRTLETTTHRGGKSPDKVDFTRAARDQKYLDEVLSNPDTKKEYNEGLTERLSASL